MRIVFFGTPPSAVPTLRAIVDAGHEVPLVVTRPDRPVGRSGTPRPPAVAVAADRLGIPSERPASLKAGALDAALRGACPDALVVVAYGKILPRTVLDAAPHGAINVHFSLLPRLRGAAPVQWALARCEDVTGVTTMLLDERMDEGPVLLQRETAIEPDEHAPALLDRLADDGAALLVETLRGLASRAIRPRPQDPSLATYAPRLRSDDGAADFALPAREVAGRVRGFDPWPGVWARRSGKRIRIVRARPGGAASRPAAPGTVLGFSADAIEVACAAGTVLEVLVVQPEGRRAVSAGEARNGRQIAEGDVLEGRAGGP